MNNLLFRSAGVVVAAALISCSGSSGSPSQDAKPVQTTVEAVQKAEVKDAQNAGDQQVLQASVSFYKSVTEGDFSGALSRLHPKALEATPKAQWVALLKDTRAKFGKLQKTNIIDSRKFDNVNTAVGKADYYQVAFENVYEKGVLYEMLSFVKQDTGEPQLLSYNYNSDKSKLAFDNF